ncbi:hypothetical protein [Sulfurimonas sp.]|uniref:hypothetical protein n=1 Tax=Sulfurimonas sp. TaxID=2022749 RepID=UPI00356A786B
MNENVSGCSEMEENAAKHSEKVTINLTLEDYERLLEMQKVSGVSMASIARKLLLEALDDFQNPMKKALDKMRDK